MVNIFVCEDWSGVRASSIYVGPAGGPVTHPTIALYFLLLLRLPANLCGTSDSWATNFASRWLWSAPTSYAGHATAPTSYAGHAMAPCSAPISCRRVATDSLHGHHHLTASCHWQTRKPFTNWYSRGIDNGCGAGQRVGCLLSWWTCRW